MMKLVIFDMDGLMFDTERVNRRAFMEVVKEKGFEPTYEQFAESLGMNASDNQALYERLYGKDVDGKAIYKEIGIRAKEIIKREGVPVKEGLREILEVIAEKKIPMAVASGSEMEVILQYMKDAGISDYFRMVLSACEIERGKPFPDIFLEICRRMKVDPEDALVLEDSENGVRAALAGNLPVINVPDLIEIPEELQKQCLAVTENLREAIPYIR
ncbi:MAG: HAD family phosphatase [Lachnospiraceae bacterium]|nr:HAD family phosphatase [Lachnospiraceae bacterium]